MRLFRFLLALLLITSMGYAVESTDPEDIVTNETMIVQSTQLPRFFQGMGVGSVASVVSTHHQADILYQGTPGAQSDLSVKGSSFSGAGLSLNGLALGNAQTEHFNTELPVPVELMSRPEVYSGFDQVLESSGFLVGTVGFDLIPAQSIRRISALLSEHDSFSGRFLADDSYSYRNGNLGLAVFGQHVQFNELDSLDNDLELSQGGTRLQWIASGGDQWDFLLSRQEKEFGARGYYGVTPDWPADEAIEDSLLLGSWQRNLPDGGRLRSVISYREHHDQYRLFWTLPGVFKNTHDLRSYRGMIDGRVYGDNGWRLDWRIQGDHEDIDSNSLGDFDRSRFQSSLIPGRYWRNGLLQLGVRAELDDENTEELLPVASISYIPSDRLRVQFAYSESLRYPSYTELNYESPASLGNAGLSNQEAATTEIRAEGLINPNITWRTGIFYRETDDAVDWVRRDATSTRWEAANIGHVETFGVEAGVRWEWRNRGHVEVGYLGLDKSHDASVYASRYALDYARHRLTLDLAYRLSAQGQILFRQSVREQAPNALRTGGETGYDAGVRVTWLVLNDPRLMIHAIIDNLWDDDYRIFPGQDTFSERRLSLGASLEW